MKSDTRKRKPRQKPPAKPRVRVGQADIESFVVQHAGEFATDRHRPRAGQTTLVQAIMLRFPVSRATVMRHLRAFAHRREKANAVVRGPIDPHVGNLLAAISRQYTGRNSGNLSVSTYELTTVSKKSNGAQASSSQDVSDVLLYAKNYHQITDAQIQEGIIAYLKECTDRDFLRQIQAVGTVPTKQAEGVGGRTLDAIGLSVRAEQAPSTQPPAFNPTEFLLEALDAYESTKGLPSTWIKGWAQWKLAISSRI